MTSRNPKVVSVETPIQNQYDLRPRITVIGVGGAGGNAVNNMIRAKLEGVEFMVANTDAQALNQSLVPQERCLHLGLSITQGLGAGSKPDVGRASAEESIEEVLDYIRGSNMLFITAGMGGGTGTGAAPVLARAARENGILTVGVVTKPFHFEGGHRMRTADSGIEELQQYVDTLIVIPNQNLFRLANERTTFADAFKMADDVLYSGVRSVTDLMIMPGLINLDFADIRAVMAEMGKAMMGTGEAEGDHRALEAAEAAISNPLLDDVSLKGAKGVLISITGGYDMTLYEVDEAANRIREDVETDANIIFGSTFDERLNGRIRVSVVATGIGGANAHVASSSSNPNVWHQQAATNNPTAAQQGNFAAAAASNASRPTASTNAPRSEPAKPMTASASASVSIQEFIAQQDLVQNPIDIDHTSMGHETDPLAEKKANEMSDLVVPAQEIPSFASVLNQAQPERKRTGSLFERFTGGRNRQAEPNPVTTATPNTDLSNETAQTEDALEIPAFMRRGSGQ